MSLVERVRERLDQFESDKRPISRFSVIDAAHAKSLKEAEDLADLFSDVKPSPFWVNQKHLFIAK